MGQARFLALVCGHPHPTDLARTAPGSATFAALHHLESDGLISRRRGLYRLTRRGRSELDMNRALTRLILRTQCRISER